MAKTAKDVLPRVGKTPQAPKLPAPLPLDKWLEQTISETLVQVGFQNGVLTQAQKTLAYIRALEKEKGDATSDAPGPA